MQNLEKLKKELPLLIEGYKKEIWEWKQKESQWILDLNRLDGHKRIVEELSQKIVELSAKIKELEGTLGSAQDINENHQRYNGKLQSRLTEVEEDNKSLAKQIEHLTNRKL